MPSASKYKLPSYGPKDLCKKKTSYPENNDGAINNEKQNRIKTELQIQGWEVP